MRTECWNQTLWESTWLAGLALTYCSMSFPYSKSEIFSLGFPFKPRFIAGRVGFRVSDGVSGWSQRNLNCVSEAEKIFLEVARTDSLVKELSSWPRGWMWGQHVVHGYGPARWSLGAWGSPIIWHWLPVCFCPKAVDLSELNCSIATCNHH
jgi:hypothetical protein